MLSRLLSGIIAVGLVWGLLAFAVSVAPAPVRQRYAVVHERIASRVPYRIVRMYARAAHRLGELHDRLTH